MARQVFVDLDDVSGVDLRDGARIERMSVAARRWSHQRSRPSSRLWKGRPRLRALALAACILLIGGTASATVWWWRGPEIVAVVSSMEWPGGLTGSRSSGAPRVRQGRAGRDGQEPVAAAIAQGGETEPAMAEAEAVPDPGPTSTGAPSALPSLGQSPRDRPRPRRLARAGQQERQQQQPLTPARLLRQASDFRRAGDVERALGLYRKLQQEFPRSSESVLSSVALGGLLLQRGLPRAALGQFDAYLASSRGGGLIPEALYGRGRALAALGDRDEERQTWDRLLADFPASAYGPLARRRLADLK